MKINYNEENVKKEFLKEMRKFSPTRMTIFLEFDIANKKATTTFRAFKTYFGNDVELVLKYNTSVEYNTEVARVVITDIELDDVLLHMILENEFNLDTYCKNLRNLKIGDSNCDYWMDTIYIKAKNKKVRHDAISFNNVQMIYKI